MITMLRTLTHYFYGHFHHFQVRSFCKRHTTRPGHEPWVIPGMLTRTVLLRDVEETSIEDLNSFDMTSAGLSPAAPPKRRAHCNGSSHESPSYPLVMTNSLQTGKWP